VLTDWDFAAFFSVLRRRVFPFGIDFGFELAAADEFLEVADDGAAGDPEFAGQRRNVRALTPCLQNP
jgi:hypothetical protein